jgi:hypothetical protein
MIKKLAESSGNVVGYKANWNDKGFRLPEVGT